MGRLGDRVTSMMNGIERYWHSAILLTFPSLFDRAGAARMPEASVTLLRDEIMPTCSVVAASFSLKKRLKRGTMKPAPKPIIPVDIMNFSIVQWLWMFRRLNRSTVLCLCSALSSFVKSTGIAAARARATETTNARR